MYPVNVRPDGFCDSVPLFDVRVTVGDDDGKLGGVRSMSVRRDEDIRAEQLQGRRRVGLASKIRCVSNGLCERGDDYGVIIIIIIIII